MKFVGQSESDAAAGANASQVAAHQIVEPQGSDSVPNSELLALENGNDSVPNSESLGTDYNASI